MKRRNTEPALTSDSKSVTDRSSIALQEKSSIMEKPDE